MTTASTINAFITRWRASGAAERANYQLFLVELCELLGVDKPQPSTPDETANAYVFEKAVPLPHGTTGFIDLYHRGRFVLEAKQGSDAAEPAPLAAAPRKRKRGTAARGTSTWDTALEKARRQAQTYARSLPPSELADGGRPPFLIVVDVGNTIELHSEFTRSGGNYVPFPDPHSYRFPIERLRDEAVRDLLRAVWTDPQSLDPARRSARVTRDIANRLAALAKLLEADHEPEQVAQFLMRCLFTMFAEDVRLLPEKAFTQLLHDLHNDPAGFKPMVEHLWGTMNSGGFSVILRRAIPRFNGGLFAQQDALPLDEAQIQLLIEAARADWRDVEPAIFGALLERALDPVERHKLGAHYTPRAYVERLVIPTIIEPLRAEWDGVQAAAAQLAEAGDDDKAVAEVAAFHRRLAATRVLDPACGTGNFLYVTLEHLKRLEGEVLNTLRDLGQTQQMLGIESVMVTPQQLLGIEVNPRAAAIAELVLWIGYLQWHLRTRGDVLPAEPIIRDFHNIERRDAVLDWDAVEPLLDAHGRPVTRWDGRTTIPHPVTGERVPDETARLPVYRYLNPRPADWPAAEFVVGNPPFLGNYRMRDALGDGYVDALQTAYPDMPRNADFVMHWWHKSATLVRNGLLRRFGLITTNSLRQTNNRRILEMHTDAQTNPLSLAFAVPDHPWVDSSEGAAVRISMTVAERGEFSGKLAEVVAENPTEKGDIDVQLIERVGVIQNDLTIGANVASAVALEANSIICYPGVKVSGSGFIIDEDQAKALGYGNDPEIEAHIKRYISGRDLNQVSRNKLVIDLYGLTEAELRQRFPQLYQWVFERVKPEREGNRDQLVRTQWWIHGRPRPELRKMLVGLDSYIATVETSKHRIFVSLKSDILPDNTVIAVGLQDDYYLGVLSSHVHVTWALAAGGRLEDRPRYQKALCFDPFPFPTPTDAQRTRIRELAEQLDAHRKRQQAQHPRLTLTDMYNVLAKLRAGEPLTDADRRVHEQGLVSVLRQLHDELDTAVLEAYGWPADLADDAILERLVALNAERAAEEARGQVRWLRPDYQAPDHTPAPATQTALLPGDATAAPTAQPPWPTELAARATAVRAALAAFARPVTAAEVAAAFDGPTTKARIT
ncbi:MAG: class I SAM-dependent DNA methyltransferase, partial [FCB group bacterium]|nr:class I SAM-dependent DNA methyltransferase [FCB group bacterium]